MSDKCTWIEWATVIGVPTNNWDTSCGHTFSVDEGKPSENDFKFCCFCGRPLDEHPALLTVVDDEPESDTANKTDESRTAPVRTPQSDGSAGGVR